LYRSSTLCALATGYTSSPLTFGDFGFTCEVVHVPRNAAASSKKRPTVSHRHPPAPLCALDDGGCHSNRPFLWVVRWRGAVSWRNWNRYWQKRGKCERNTVLFSPEKQSWGPKGAYDARLCPWLGSDGVNRPFLRCATAVSLPVSVSPAPVAARVWAPAARPAFYSKRQGRGREFFLKAAYIWQIAAIKMR
jgi:hypothetical protein